MGTVGLALIARIYCSLQFGYHMICFGLLHYVSQAKVQTVLANTLLYCRKHAGILQKM